MRKFVNTCSDACIHETTIFEKQFFFCFMISHLQDHVPPMHNSAPSRSRYRDTLVAALLHGARFKKCIWKSYVNSPVSPLAPVIYWLSLPLRQQWDFVILKSWMSILYCIVVKNAWCFVDIPCQKPKTLLHQEFVILKFIYLYFQVPEKVGIALSERLFLLIHCWK